MDITQVQLENNQSPSNQYLEQQNQVNYQQIFMKTKTNVCPAIKNHSAVIYNQHIYIFGGYDSKKNHNAIHIYSIDQQDWISKPVSGKEPEGRNGHTATVVDHRMFVIGGWLGSGTHASSDVYILDLDRLFWTQGNTHGEVPGPCNMHSADLIGKMIYIFRGGDGKDYLNDLHCLNTETHQWRLCVSDGDCPPSRANHSSAVVKNKLFIFGGWDGSKRLNDLYCYDTDIGQWSEIRTNSPPQARAGMCMATLSDKIYMFGGSGPQATCYFDLQIYDPIKNQWSVPQINDQEGVVRARAGHSMTAVNDKIYIFGGSCGQQYYKDFFIIETDAPPEVFGYCKEKTQKKLNYSLRSYFNNDQFSDITFIVEDRQFFAHKIICSQLCENLRVTFKSKMREALSDTITITDTKYEVFSVLMWFLYTGEVLFQITGEVKTPPTLQFLLELLKLSDCFLVDEVKFECEKHLQSMINPETLQIIQYYSEICNASQLKLYCEWYGCHIIKACAK